MREKLHSLSIGVSCSACHTIRNQRRVTSQVVVSVPILHTSNAPVQSSIRHVTKSDLGDIYVAVLLLCYPLQAPTYQTAPKRTR